MFPKAYPKNPEGEEPFFIVGEDPDLTCFDYFLWRYLKDKSNNIICYLSPYL